MSVLAETIKNTVVQGVERLSKQPWDKFTFENKVSPFTTNKEVFIGFCTYFVIIFGIQAIMRKFNVKPLQLKWLFFVHNCILTVVSAALLTGFAYNLFPIMRKHGILYAMCNVGSYTQQMELLYYLNYLVKWWELIDTLFLVLKRKKLGFLHVYHHSFTMVLCYVELVGRVSVAWVVITINLAIHVVMYYYYARTSIIKKRVWWKKYLTTMQIVQFIIDIAIIYFVVIANNLYKFFPNFIFAFPCAGTDFAHIFGCMIVTSYLFLFIDFFKETYKTKASKTSKKSASKQKVESKKSKKSKNSKKSTKLRQRNKKQNIGHDSAFSEH
ncbi:GNS1/SUR4 membrane protein [Neocallimastix lanati (nom. inval.)]|jgi:hypothetical protein|uniref:Elongation of fatty acids protein n=1 Tax=Neocallimastix californiae TaxID=1754190 RepID=A0A1Y2CQE1_9FUNG|nr:GNS1/SUR4 membrane protein [Neocallimastix sp. JGI-2020a]ORY49250.1 GNS1/SUR4 membrane protein [Neocallimastix californiae]|eukprot:ORY49250.1 GNS1/SUR4 membrane protein [Neocallimastix californiae]